MSLTQSSQVGSPVTCQTSLEILYVTGGRGRSVQRERALRDLGHNVQAIQFDPTWYEDGRIHRPCLLERILRKAGYPPDPLRTNIQVLEAFQNHHFDVLWVEKALMLRPGTLTKIKQREPKIKIVFNSEDDMYVRWNQSAYFRAALPLYDVIFTTKSFNCEPGELPSLGARHVVMVDKAYDPNFHRPIPVTDEDRRFYGAGVCFIGTYEDARARLLLFLAENGIEVRIWGSHWEQCRVTHPNLRIERRPLFDDDYIRAICASDIVLCFLRKANRDMQTARTVEIPACGAFMLAERTDEHRRLFEEDTEAAYFDPNDPQELLAKVRYYLEHPLERQAIAARGHKRCLISGYSHHDRLREMLRIVQKLHS